jgi:hypothetical protein
MYSDDSLNYCLTDRAPLIPATISEEVPTVIRDYSAAPETKVIKVERGVSPIFKYLAVGLGILLLLLTGAGLAAWSLWNSRSEQTEQTSNAATPMSGTAPSRNTVKDLDRVETPTPAKTPAASPTVPKDTPKSDQGTARITFKKGSVSQSLSGTVVHTRSFVLRTMAGQSLTATINSAGGCVQFEAGGDSVRFSTPNGDVSLDLRNTCEDPAAFSMNVTVR